LALVCGPTSRARLTDRFSSVRALGGVERTVWDLRQIPYMAVMATDGAHGRSPRQENRKIAQTLKQQSRMSIYAEQRANSLLAALPDPEWRRWEPLLEQVEMPLSQVLYEPGTTLTHVYFPTTSIVSLLYVMENGASAEIAVVGNEGLLGVSLFMGGESTPSRAVVQSAGHGFRLKAQLMKEEFNRAGPVLHLLLRYTQALITQMSQTAVCNRHHTLDQQLCRWLLLSLDRLQANELTMTQELIANMLGVRREVFSAQRRAAANAGKGIVTGWDAAKRQGQESWRLLKVPTFCLKAFCATPSKNTSPSASGTKFRLE
jgi:CRP-like cAMP-binding protein